MPLIAQHRAIIPFPPVGGSNMQKSRIRVLGLAGLVPGILILWLILDYDNLVARYGAPFILSIATVLGIIIVALASKILEMMKKLE